MEGSAVFCLSRIRNRIVKSLLTFFTHIDQSCLTDDQVIPKIKKNLRNEKVNENGNGDTLKQSASALPIKAQPFDQIKPLGVKILR